MKCRLDMFNSFLFSAERKPISRNLLLSLIVLSVLTVFLLHLRSGIETTGSAWALAFVSALLFIAGGYVLSGNQSTPGDYTGEDKMPTFFNNGILLAGCGVVLAVLSSYLHDFSAASSISFVSTFFLLGLRNQLVPRYSQAESILTPLLCASIFTGAAGLLGNPAIGVFPAAIVFLLVFVIQVTLNVEKEIRNTYSEIDEESIYHRYRKRFAWTASVFFLFGVVSFWPWLGMIYNDAYFWLLIFGVILPMVFFWGRLRQPRSEGPYTALLRFNRVSPLIAGVLLIAFAIG
ncbi:hypothetical protein KKG66_01780 [bacterium]|nr:hypothetical protein [bacterium]